MGGDGPALVLDFSSAKGTDWGSAAGCSGRVVGAPFEVGACMRRIVHCAVLCPPSQGGKHGKVRIQSHHCWYLHQYNNNVTAPAASYVFKPVTAACAGAFSLASAAAVQCVSCGGSVAGLEQPGQVPHLASWLLLRRGTPGGKPGRHGAHGSRVQAQLSWRPCAGKAAQTGGS